MPKGVYKRSKGHIEHMKKNLAKGRTPEVRAKANATIRELYKDPELRKKVAVATKEAFKKPEVKRNLLISMTQRFGYDYSDINVLAPSLPGDHLLAKVFLRRLWTRIDIKGPDDCWPYTSNVDGYGYGKFWIGCAEVRAHRVVMMLILGRELDEGEQSLHHCDNPPCCNPGHLFLGNNAINVADKMTKGRHPKGELVRTAKLTEQDVRAIRLSDLSVSELAKKYGVQKRAIQNVIKRKTWKHVK